MIKLDGMLMIGSAGTNLGKTELACALVRKFSKRSNVAGIKVTTIKERDGQCPRGGQGCGVCSSLDGVYCITEETNSNSKKDTARLLAAGASRVFWLRVMKTHLKEGLSALIDIIGPDAVSICESNSLRQVVEPGLFLMVKGRGREVWKGSAQEVRKYADGIVVAGTCGFDFDIDQIKLSDGKWTMPIKATAIILAGGDSCRMGTDKSMLVIKSRPIIETICEQLRGTFGQILISANEVDKYAFLGSKIVPDKMPGQGPLMGIASALEASANELNFVVACDIPYIDLAFVRKMLTEAKTADVVIPTTGDEKYEPLFAVYTKSALGTINEVLSSGGRKISDVFARCRVKHIELGAEWFMNLNTMAEYEKFQKKYAPAFLRKQEGALNFDDAFEIVMGSARQLGPPRRVGIEHALNRILAEDVVSDIEIPPFNKSAMDGFACRRADLANELTVIETIPAGYMPKKTIGPNKCAKIMTGAVVPEGADCVIMVEYTETTAEGRIRFTNSSTTDNICLKGEDIKKGDVVLRDGCRIAAQHIAVLASHGCVRPLVALQPRVGIIATGNELVEPGQKPAAFQIRNSNGPQLAAQVTSVGAIATNYGIAADTEEAIEAIVKKAIAENDVVILSGGVSVGDYDLVREILRKNNVKLLFEKIAVKPGRPTVFGVKRLAAEDAESKLNSKLIATTSAVKKNECDTKFVFGLPGNPVSTFITFELLVKPFLFKMMGHNFKPAVARVTLERTIARKKTERDSWVPVIFIKSGKAASIEYHGSAHINALCEADGLVCIPAGVAEIKEGTTVAVRQI